jgi:hypothetical protein
LDGIQFNNDSIELGMKQLSLKPVLYDLVYHQLEKSLNEQGLLKSMFNMFK